MGAGATSPCTVKVLGVKEGFSDSDVAVLEFIKRVVGSVIITGGDPGGRAEHNVTLTKAFLWEPQR